MKTRFQALLLWFAVLMMSNNALAQATASDAFAAASPDMELPLVAALRAEYGSSNVTLIQVNTDVLRTTAADAPVTLNVTPTLRFAGVTRETQELGQGRYLWRGELSGAGDLPEGSATLVINGDNLTGSITSPQGDTYKIQPVGNGVNAVIKVNYAEKYPNQGPPRRPYGGGTQDTKSSADLDDMQVAADGAPVIDVLVVYTQSVAAASNDVISLIALAVSETNTSFTRSQINASIRLVGTMQINYTEPKTANGLADWDQMLRFATNNSNIAQQRNAVGADLVVFLVNHTAYCGMAWVNSNAAYAFSAVHYGCATGNYTFAHEIGHNLGAGHDTETDINPYYSYGHGHLQRTGGWHTIMSYPCSDNRCRTRIQNWSNPSVNYGTHPTGNTATDNNARVWNERAATVAAFRSPVHTVSTNAGTGGSISPASAQVNSGAPHTFTVTPNAGHYISSISGCGGTAFTGNSSHTSARSYTTGAITAACTVSATFTASSASFAFQEAFSRKTHGSSGTFDLPISATGSLMSSNPITVEPRSGGTNRAFE
ncbi:MAG: M12 family metallo-peptidase, partial [Proteobacteria bacterium]|nr:M12 family metallo-peptidase [Pseudomonadota bacterium]